LGMIHQVRATGDALAAAGIGPDRVVVAANRLDPEDPVGAASVAWLRDHDGWTVTVDPHGFAADLL
ncbi:MAG: hypothetical protein WCI50_15215, partial [Actinomycetes bacterium]